MNFQAFYYVFHKIIKWGDILSRDAFLFLLACNKDKKCHPISCTGKSLSEALLFAEHVVYKNCSECQKQFLYKCLIETPCLFISGDFSQLHG